MPRVDPSDVSRRTMLRVAVAGAGIILMQPLGALFATRATAAELTTAPPSTAEDSASQKAAGWLSRATLPPGAIRSASSPSPYFDIQHTEWWCAPMAVKTAYWRIAGASVAETANWLNAHPTADLTVPVQHPIPADADVDIASVGNVPFQGALEGIAFTVAKMSDGVAVRGEFGAIPESATRRNFRAGTGLGGPGQG
ncbi:hypothetical protein [Microbacterium immunditiarum]|uniref:Uncharacterized protein n=1 Tax=Microbacterium immunditiarum TaxID=337480 RepID=A0A7Y9KG25_9MICO|nr:hypothetical protein [Microbacterium immunditiarum]NYE17977.1 hypothetical protein [Microbacterium immunditiarum]